MTFQPAELISYFRGSTWDSTTRRGWSNVAPMR